MSERKLLELARMRSYWKEHPEVFMKDILELELTPNQLLMLKSIQHYNKTTVKSSNSTGKTVLCGGIVLWYFYTHTSSDEATIVLMTAPQFIQVRSGIYAKFKDNIDKANKNLSRLAGQEVKIFDKPPSEDKKSAAYYLTESSFVMGFSTDNMNAIAGKHAENILIIFDEAQGLKDDVYSGFAGIKQSGIIKEVLIGNPTLKDGCVGKFYESFSESSDYKKITISAFDTPNFKNTTITLDDYFREENDPLYWRNKLDRFAKTNYKEAKAQNRVAKWEEDVLNSFGRYKGLQNPLGVYTILQNEGMNIDSYEVQTRVLGIFPTAGSNAIYPIDWINASMERWSDDTLWIRGERCLGIDFGRGVGVDRSAFSVVDGNRHVYVAEEDLDTRGIINKAVYLAQQYNVDVVKVERNGEGIHLARLLREEGLNVAEVDVGASPGYGKTFNYFLKQKNDEYKKMYYLKRDEIWWNLRLLISPEREEGQPLFLIYPDATLKVQMRAGTYSRNAKQQICVVSKDELRVRLKRSPDKLDSLLIALAEVEYEAKSAMDYSNLYLGNIKSVSE